MVLKKTWLVVGIIALVILIDQALKIWVKTHLLYGEMIPLFGSAHAFLHFVENDGMAFGKTFNIPYGKLVLSVFRILAAGLLLVYIRSLLDQPQIKQGLLVAFALIFAGALGNIIDSTFYGLIFSDSYSHGLPATFLPVGGGYGDFLYGKVVDMLYFPLFDLQIPNWLPWWGGSSLLIFGPVFNIADTAITFGVLQILLFHRSFFNTEKTVVEKDAENRNDSAREDIRTTTHPLHQNNQEDQNLQ